LILAGGKVLADGLPMEALSPAVLAEAYGVEAKFSAGQTGPLIEVIGRRG